MHDFNQMKRLPAKSIIWQVCESNHHSQNLWTFYFEMTFKSSFSVINTPAPSENITLCLSRMQTQKSRIKAKRLYFDI